MESMNNLGIARGNPFPLGVTKTGNKIQFAVSVNNAKECRLNLYRTGEKEKETSILMDESVKTGNIFSVLIENFPYEGYEYLYEVKGKEFLDPYAKVIRGREEWGKELSEDEKLLIRCGCMFDEYDWEGDRQLCIPYHDSILYQLHVRGFTRHNSSKVKHKGTFKGIEEKIPYLKGLDVNGIVLLPVYEFNEIMKDEINENNPQYFTYYSEQKGAVAKLNYWGYGRGCSYFAPKSSYASDRSNCIKELKNLVKELHKNGIEIILEMCFEKGSNPNMIIDCFRFWVLEYHIDGFYINDDVVPSYIIASDPILSNTKLLATSWQAHMVYQDNYIPEYKHLAEYNNGFLVDSRRLLKSDEEQVGKFIERMKNNQEKIGVVNYITNMNGFTLMDLVSYDIKHNEVNGENGKDGTDYNYSWNCGIEGKTKRKNVLSLRRKQIKNALLMLVLSQGTPMFLSGDEFGNTCSGNNNAYCQDNAISWINWNQYLTNQDIFLFLKKLIKLRREHKILHMPTQLRVMDYISCGCPDISFHGTKAWYPDFSNYSRVFGVMLCGRYAKIGKVDDDEDFYIAFNMHWEPHEFDLPSPSKDKVWKVLLDTSTETEKEFILLDKKNYLVKPRTIVVLISQEQKDCHL